MSLYIILNLIILLLLSLLFSSVSILIVGLIGMLIVIYLAKKTSINFYKILSIAFIVSIIMMLIAYWGYSQQYGIPYFSGGSDDLAFENMSKYVMDMGYSSPGQYVKDPLLRFHNSKGFLWIISGVMKLVEPFGGYHTVAYRVLNINFLIGLGILITSFFKNNYGFKDNKNVVVLVVSTLFPNATFISIHVFRDTLIIFLLFAIFYIWDNFLKKEKRGFNSLLKIIFLTSVITYISFWIRNQSLIFIVAIILVSIFINKRTISLKNFGVMILLSFAAIFIFEILDVFEMIIAFNERYTVHKLNISDGLSNAIFRIPLFPFGVFVRFAYGLISPIPVPILNTPKMFSDIKIFFDVIVSYGTVAQIFLLPYIVKNIKKIDKVFIVFILFMLGIVVTTFTFRHFIMLYPFMIILIFREFFITSKVNKIIYFGFVSMGIVLAASIYLLIR